jgi:hypothetical protein
MLMSGVGGAELELALKISRSEDRLMQLPYQLDARVYVGGGPSGSPRMLCHVRAPNLVAPTVRQGEVRLNGFVTDEQLRIVEHVRRGGDLWVTLRLSASSAEWSNEPTRTERRFDTVEEAAEALEKLPKGVTAIVPRPLLRTRTGEIRFDINAGEWGAQMESIQAGAFLELLVPLSGGEAYEIAVGRLRKARELLRDNRIDEALGQARQALDPVRDWYNTTKTVNAARKRERDTQAAEERSPQRRTFDERWAFMVEDLFSTLSGALHDDEITKTFTYSRAYGQMLVTSVAGMLHRLAEDTSKL